ncbi:hypothetical protein OIU84_018954 [Salix udensis]|uniref:Uncharacterized protein n=1 Tax=Salix udensis TaxID=889485 RepID=A0AAD6L019_9ROSI|nr:hypothetical protein OIU84_018954 [Salix udensis]
MAISPRKILFIFATMSSMGTVMLIYILYPCHQQKHLMHVRRAGSKDDRRSFTRSQGDRNGPDGQPEMVLVSLYLLVVND